jgi:hypothetical protein
MEMIFVVLVHFSGGNFQALEVVAMDRAEFEIGKTAKGASGCESALAKPLAAKRLRSEPARHKATISYRCMGASQLGSLADLVQGAKSWGVVSKP